MKKLVTALVLSAALLTASTMASCSERPAQQEEQQTEEGWLDAWTPEIEDCDAEDWAKYERECHRRSPAPRASTAAQPSPRKTPGIVLQPKPQCVPTKTKRC